MQPFAGSVGVVTRTLAALDFHPHQLTRAGGVALHPLWVVACGEQYSESEVSAHDDLFDVQHHDVVAVDGGEQLRRHPGAVLAGEGHQERRLVGWQRGHLGHGAEATG